jgi:hypothetical protein
LAIGIDIIGAVVVEWVEFAAGNKHLQVDNLGALRIERLQLAWRERDVSAALIFVPPDDLLFLNFFARAGIMGSKRDPSCGAYSFRLILDVIGSEPRRRSFGDILCSDLVLRLATALVRRSSPNLV